jgi:hypothetical protein
MRMFHSPTTKVVLPDPQVNAREEAPPAAQASISANPRKFARLGKNLLKLRTAMSLMSITEFNQGAPPSHPKRPNSPPTGAVENSDLTHHTATGTVLLAQLAREDPKNKGAEEMVPADSGEGSERKPKRKPKRKAQSGNDDDKEDQA